MIWGVCDVRFEDFVGDYVFWAGSAQSEGRRYMHPDIKSLPAWSPHPYTQGEPPASLSKVDRRDRLQISSRLFCIFMWQIRLHVQKREDSAIEEEMPKSIQGAVNRVLGPVNWVNRSRLTCPK